jgi:hypothetical protein
MSDVKTDASGKIIIRAVTGWTLSHVDGAFLLLAIEYVDSPGELQKGIKHQLTVSLHPRLALDLADKLKSNSESILAGFLPQDVIVH